MRVWKQYPTQFEFSEQFLLYIVFHSTSGRFSTFLYNCEKERKEAGPVGVSFWAHLNSPSQRYHRPEFTNLLYTPSAATTMKPVNWPRILHYWEECHAQLDHDWTDLWSEPVSRKLMNLGRELEDHRVKRPKLEAALDAALKKRVDAGLDCYASTTRFTNLVKRPRDVPDMVRQLLEETVLTRLWDHIDHFSTRSRAPSFAASMLSLDMFRGHKAPSVMGPGGRWVPDSMAPCCAACLKPFQWFRRRHHCRVCGNVFCASHSRLRCVLAEHPSAGFVRVCSDCHAAVNRPGTRTASPAPQPTPSVSFGYLCPPPSTACSLSASTGGCLIARPACLKPFQWFRRRHHCRVCGNVFCASHSRLRCVLAEHPSAGFVRVR
ncbi:Lateral signaling target protein 2-like protein [Diplonema papillatum]|nr:Lateral signaling target protein 2-like protein [Diplonema papillatum]